MKVKNRWMIIVGLSIGWLQVEQASACSSFGADSTEGMVVGKNFDWYME